MLWNYVFYVRVGIHMAPCIQKYCIIQRYCTGVWVTAENISCAVGNRQYLCCLRIMMVKKQYEGYGIILPNLNCKLKSATLKSCLLFSLAWGGFVLNSKLHGSNCIRTDLTRWTVSTENVPSITKHIPNICHCFVWLCMKTNLNEGNSSNSIFHSIESCLLGVVA